MPELPEVARALLAVERAVDRPILAVDDTDTYVCRPHAPGDIARVLVGGRLASAHRQGKSMWCETVRADGSAGPALGIHLGMSGRIVVTGPHGEVGGGERVRAVGNPVWDRFTIDFADGGRLRLFDKRRLGRVRLDPDLLALGPDAALITRTQFRRRVGRGKAPLKARLLDQGTLAGVGNLLADETLWRARLSPLRPAGALSEEELDALRVALRAAIRRAHRLGGVHTGDLIEHRHPGGRCPRCGAELVRAVVGSRTTWWCPAEQL